MADAAEAEALPKGARDWRWRGRQRRLSRSQPLLSSLPRPRTPPAPTPTHTHAPPSHSLSALATHVITTEFEAARPLALPEVRAILAARREKQEEEEGAAAPPPPLQAKALAYAERFDAIRSAVRAHEAEAALVARGLLSPSEVASLINLMPGTADEAVALIPSLGAADRAADLPEAVLQEVLDELQTYKGLE